MPDPLKNLYEDLRNRKMLPLVGLLIVAIIAVPLLLKSGPGTQRSAAGLGTVDGAGHIPGSEIADPVVLTEVPGIRSFHQRLASLQERNPFKQQLAGGAADAERKKANAALSKDTAQAAADVLSSGDSTTATADGGGDTTTPTGTTTSTDTTTPTDPDQQHKKTFIFYSEIDVKVGLVGKGEKRKGVKPLKFLPGKSHPVVQYIQGIGEHAAIFVVSRSVQQTRGTGNCQPRPDDCQFLKLKPGQDRTFRYEPNGLDYRIKLTGIHQVRKQVDPNNPSG